MDHRPGRVLVALVTACAALLGFGAAGSVPPSAAQVTGTGAGSATGSTPGGDHAPPALASTSQAVRAGLLPTGPDTPTWPLAAPPVAGWACAEPAGGGAGHVGGARRTGAQYEGVVGARAPPAGGHPVTTGQRPPPPTA